VRQAASVPPPVELVPVAATVAEMRTGAVRPRGCLFTHRMMQQHVTGLYRDRRLQRSKPYDQPRRAVVNSAGHSHGLRRRGVS
jgi:hypothetical protein